MAFAQLTYRESLRDIETCLCVQASRLYHMGFREPIRRSTLSLSPFSGSLRVRANCSAPRFIPYPQNPAGAGPCAVAFPVYSHIPVVLVCRWHDALLRYFLRSTGIQCNLYLWQK
jgi:hypothetical protein